MRVYVQVVLQLETLVRLVHLLIVCLNDFLLEIDKLTDAAQHFRWSAWAVWSCHYATGSKFVLYNRCCGAQTEGIEDVWPMTQSCHLLLSES